MFRFWVAAVILIGSAASVAFSQVSADEAQKRLAEKMAARDRDRSTIVSISKGELDDLKGELAKLRAQVASLQAQVSKSTAPGSSGVKLVPKIAVGISREELLRFVAVHKAQYEIVSDMPTQVRAVAGGPGGAGGPGLPAAAVEAQSPGGGWAGTVIVTGKARRKVFTGIGSNGVSRVAEYHEEMRPDVTITATLLNGAVARITEVTLPAAPDENERFVR